MRLPGRRSEIALPLSVRHNVMNALAAAAAAYALDVPMAVIRQGLESASSVKGRLQRHSMADGWILIDDSYNANPGSSEAAIDTLAAEQGDRWLVLGDMRELGPAARERHARVGALARERGIGRLFTVGALAKAAADALVRRRALRRSASADSVWRRTCTWRQRAGQGSRGSAMDNVVRALSSRARPAGNKRHAA
jgi:UDP-N-acetylmuramoyl-tripeptide--D-alanyl-D-alanine ligase